MPYPAAFASRFAHERDTPNCRAAVAPVMPASCGCSNDVPLLFDWQSGLVGGHVCRWFHLPHKSVFVPY